MTGDTQHAASPQPKPPLRSNSPAAASACDPVHPPEAPANEAAEPVEPHPACPSEPVVEEDSLFYYPCRNENVTYYCYHTHIDAGKGGSERVSPAQRECTCSESAKNPSTTSFRDVVMNSPLRDVCLKIASENYVIANALDDTRCMDCQHAQCSTGFQALFPYWYLHQASKEKMRNIWVDAVPGIQMPSQTEDSLISCVFIWTHGGHEVYLVGSFTDWVENKIKMTRNGHEFIAILKLPRGVHHYKFIVDSHWKFAPNQATIKDSHNNINNILDITNYEHYSFVIPSEHEKVRNESYAQFVPSANDYTTEAPSIPVLLSRSDCAASDTQSRFNSFLHVLSNHLYFDSQTSSLFGLHITCVTSTFRWRRQHISHSSICGQRYSTITYITFNPLFSYHGDPVFELQAASLLRGIVGERQVPNPSPNSSLKCSVKGETDLST